MATPNTGSATPIDCICGAEIVLVEGTEDVWVSVTGGSALCYPEESGPDGEARHEPQEPLP